MAIVSLQVSSIMNLGLWDKVCEYKGWEPWIYNEGRVPDDEWVEFDDTFKKEESTIEEKYFLTEDAFLDKIYLYEKDGTFYDHDDQDILVATFEDKKYAELICKMLNETDLKD
jgi:hypothetical protein